MAETPGTVPTNPESFWGNADPCREGFQDEYAAFLNAAAAACGNIAVNAPFDENWRPRWTTDNSPDLLPVSGYYIGDARLDNGNTAPVVIGVLDQGHKRFPGNQDGASMLYSTLQCLQGDVDPRDLRIVAYDQSPERFAALHNRGPEVFEQPRTLDGVLTRLEDTIHRIQSDFLRGRYGSIRDMAAKDPTMAAAGHRTEPWHIAAIVGDNTPLKPEQLERLRWIATYGRACGVSLLTCNIPLPDGLPDFEIVGGDLPITPRTPPSPEAVAATAAQVRERLQRPPASPKYESFERPERIWQGDIIAGIAWPIGINSATGEIVMCSFDDGHPHAYVAGRSGLGKTAFLLANALGRAERYGPDKLVEYYIDLKDSGTDGALLAGANALPQLGGVFVNVVDYEVVVDLLQRLAVERQRRSELFASVGANDIASYLQVTAGRQDAEPCPRISVTIDELQEALRSPLGAELLRLLDDHARKSRSAGIHLTIATQKMVSADEVSRSRTDLSGMLAQFGLRMALPKATGVLSSDNTSAENLPLHQLVFNAQAGANAPGANVPVRFTYAGVSDALAVKNRIAAEGGVPAHHPPLYNGREKPKLAADSTYQGLGPSRGIRPPRALIGKEPTLEGNGATVDFRSAAGRNLLIFGRDVGASCDVVDTVVESLAKQHNVARQESGHQAVINPAIFHIVSASRDDAQLEERADRLCGKLEAAHQRYTPYPAEDVGRAIDRAAAEVAARRTAGERPADKQYVIIVGADRATKDEIHGEKLAKLMTEGPAVGVHTILAAGSPRGFQSLVTDKYGTAPAIPSLTDAWATTSDVPETDLGPLFPGSTAPALKAASGRVFMYDKEQAARYPGPRKLRVYDTSATPKQ